MIKKTMTITSIAILVAAISVATTMTLVQADPTNDFVDINVPTADTTDLNIQITGAVEYTSFIGDGGHPITVDIDGGAETVDIDLTGGSPNTDDIILTISDIQWVGESGTISDFTCSSSVGATSIPKFNRDTLLVNITGVTVDTTIDITCEFDAEHGFVSKTLLEPCLTDGVEVKNDTAQVCTFHISYIGANATIVDTLPAEWNATTVVFGANTGTGGGGCTVDGVPDVSTGKNKKANKKSATGFTCEDIGEDAEIDVTVDLRKSPGKGHAKRGEIVFKPTGCELQINSGATALLVNVTSGQLAIGTLDGLPLVLNSTDPLDVLVVSSSNRDVDCP